MINVSAAPLSLIYQKCERRSAPRSQLKIRAPLLQLLPACERSLRAELKRAPLINDLVLVNPNSDAAENDFVCFVSVRRRR